MKMVEVENTGGNENQGFVKQERGLDFYLTWYRKSLKSLSKGRVTPSDLNFEIMYSDFHVENVLWRRGVETVSQCVQVEVVVTWTAWWQQKWKEIDGLGHIMELEVTDVADGMGMEVEETKGI